MKPATGKIVPWLVATGFVSGLAWHKYATYIPPVTADPKAARRAKLRAAAWEALQWSVIFFLIVFTWKATRDP